MALTWQQQSIYNLATSKGWDAEAASIAVAVAQAEGISGKVGDNGCSYGHFQLNFCGGQGNTWANQAFGGDVNAAKQALVSDWGAADSWFLDNSLGPAINNARTFQGLSGAQLALTAGKAAEKPIAGAEQKYAAAFLALFGDNPPSAGLGQVNTAVGTVANNLTGGTVGSTVTQAQDAAGGVTGTLQSIADGINSLLKTVAGIPQSIVGSTGLALADTASLLGFFGQVHIWERISLVLLGGLLVVVGLILFALSFLPRGSVPIPVPV